MSSQHHQQRILENSIVIWLDSIFNESNIDFQYSLNQLRRVTNSIKTFIHADQCMDYLTDIKHEKAFMIVSDALGQQVMPLIEQIPQLHAIYIFCGDQTRHEHWIKDYYKVKGIFTRIEPLCDILKRDIRQTDIYFTPISIVSVSSAIDLNQLDQSFMYSQLLKEILLEMEYDEKAKTEFIEFCQIQHVDNESSLHVIDEFERKYDRPSPIWWYTRDCFIYSMLNKALRTQDTEIIIKMGFFLRDLHRQIEQLHSNSKNRSLLTVYRGQGMFRAEFEQMRKSKGGLLSFNNFLSTSTDRQLSFMYADSTRENEELIGVLFQMEIDPSISTTPFASLDDMRQNYEKNPRKSLANTTED
ncbi:unnamed protein product [Rotaria sp. Silwood2]|nr:unnamed protein product [Rotaria sp. Silwood2]